MGTFLSFAFVTKPVPFLASALGSALLADEAVKASAAEARRARRGASDSEVGIGVGIRIGIGAGTGTGCGTSGDERNGSGDSIRNSRAHWVSPGILILFLIHINRHPAARYSKSVAANSVSTI